MRYPSVKTIAKRLQLDVDQAMKIRKIMEDDRQSMLVAFSELSTILGASGSEVIEGRDGILSNDMVEYVNLGDPYYPTVMHDYKSSRWLIGAWGDVVERQQERFADR